MPTRETLGERWWREAREQAWREARQETLRRATAAQHRRMLEQVVRARVAEERDPTGTTRLTPEELFELSSRLSDVPANPETGWRFGGVTRDGAVKSPFVPRMPLPPAGHHAVCLFGVTSGLALASNIRARLDHVPPEPRCTCGLAYVTELDGLVDYFSPDWPDKAVARLRRLVHGGPLGLGYVAARPAPAQVKLDHDGVRRSAHVVYEVEVWGETDRGDDVTTTWGERRASDLRVKPGGRLFLHKSRAEHAKSLADLYRVEVIVGTADDKLAWIEEVVAEDEQRRNRGIK